MLSSVRQSKTHCYENDFTLPDVPSLLTVILDVIRALTVPRLNRSAIFFQSSSQKKKEGNRDIYIYIKALDAICTDVFWMGGFTEQSIPSASHTWADVRGEVLLRPSHVRRDC